MRRLVGLILMLLLPSLMAAQSPVTTHYITAAGDTVRLDFSASVNRPAPRVDTVVKTLTRTDTLYREIEVPQPAIVSVPSSAIGKPFGPFNAFQGYSTIGVGPWSLALIASDASGLPRQLDAARARGMRLILAMTGGSHAKYITNNRFDLAKWKARQKTFDTPALKAAVAAAVADGTILGASIMDEPQHASWGGVPTPAMLDEMARYVKAIFPSLPVAVVVQWTWHTSTPMSSVDFMIAQYSYRHGPVEAYVDSALASARRRGTGLLFSMNALNGGTRLDPCPAGQYEPSTVNCMMTAGEILVAGKELLSNAGCGLLVWQYEESYMARPEQAAALSALAAYAGRQPAPPCRRPWVRRETHHALS